MDLVKVLMVLTYIGFEASRRAECAPYFGDDDDYFRLTESRRKHNKKKQQRPCGKNEQPNDSRTFLPWQISYVNVNYNYDCGGGGSQQHAVSSDESNSGGSKPHHGHGGHKPSHHHQHNHFVNSKPLQDHQTEDETNQDVSEKPSSSHRPHRPHRPGGNRPVLSLFQGLGTGGFFGLFDGSLINNFLGNTNNKPKPPAGEQEIPVHEDQDDVLPDATEKWSPGQYIVGYSPLTGQHVQDVSGFNPKRVFRQVDRFLRPLYNIF